MKKLLGIVFAVVLSVIFVGSFGMLIFFGIPLEAPEGITVHASNGQKYLETTVCEDAKGYLWNIKAVGGLEFTITTDGNILDVSSYVSNNVKYLFKVAYKAEIQNANSKYSKEKEYTFIDELPAVHISHNAASKIISWQAVDDATSYKVFFQNEAGIKSFETAGSTFSYSSVDGGNYYVYVRALDSTGSYSESLISNMVNVVILQKYPNPTFISFNKTTGVLTIQSQYELKEVDILHAGVDYVFTEGPAMTVTQNPNRTYRIELNLKSVFNGVNNIGYRAAAYGNFEASGYSYIMPT